jgi:N-acetylmuramoyl-L-alanine amidase
MKRIAVSVFIFFLAAFFLGEGRAAIPVLKIRHWSGIDSTRVVVELGGPPAYQDKTAADPSALKIQLRGVSLPDGKRELAVNDRVIRAVTIESGGKEVAEIQISLVKATRYKIFSLRSDGDKPNRLVIDVFRPPEESPKKVESLPAPLPKEEPAEQSQEAVEAEKEKLPAIESAKMPEKRKDPASQFPKILDIRPWVAPDHSRVVIDMEAAAAYEIIPQTDPLSFGILLRQTILSKGRQELAINDQVIGKMVVEPAGPENVQILLTLIKPGRCNVFSLKPYQDKPDRLVIDVFRPDLEEKEKADRKVSQELKTKKTRIVVIDPGHGGEDPGAIGPNGTREKDIVLAVARKLQKALDETGEFKAFLTRRGDYFVPLYDRVKIGMEYGADLFISLHANGNTSRQVRGTSVYCLSPTGASDKATQLLAQKENASDIMGGVALGGIRKDLNSILKDLELTHTINESLHLGGVVLGELSRINYIQSSRPRQAGFAVLRAPNFPSVLVELAYVTHPLEEKNLKRENFQIEASKAIVNAVKKFMPVLSLKEEGTVPESARAKRARAGDEGRK